MKGGAEEEGELVEEEEEGAEEPPQAAQPAPDASDPTQLLPTTVRGRGRGRKAAAPSAPVDWRKVLLEECPLHLPFEAHAGRLHIRGTEERPINGIPHVFWKGVLCVVWRELKIGELPTEPYAQLSYQKHLREAVFPPPAYMKNFQSSEGREIERNRRRNSRVWFQGVRRAR